VTIEKELTAMRNKMSKKIWIPDTDDAELIKLYISFEETFCKFRTIKTRIAREEIDLKNAERDLVNLSNVINNLKSNKSTIVSIREFKTIVSSKKFFIKFIDEKRKSINCDILLLEQVQKKINEIQKKIDARKNFTNVIRFRKR
jgi:hypothetical protein